MEENEAYWVGQFGPDPLFFHPLARRSGVRALGHALHHRPVRKTMEALREAIREGHPFAAGYGAGFFCHFALDSRFHPLINELRKTGRITHTGVEAELDRMLLEERRAEGRGELPLPSLKGLPDGFYQTILTSAYPGVNQEEFKQSFQSFRLVSKSYIRLLNSPLRSCLTRGDCKLYRDRMTRLFRETVEETAIQMVSFFGEAHLDSWYDRDFCSGQVKTTFAAG